MDDLWSTTKARAKETARRTSKPGRKGKRRAREESSCHVARGPEMT